MSENKTHNVTIRRIVVAIDGSPHSRAALEAAAEMARLLQAELTGVFVEDINLIRLAELPFAREVCQNRPRSEKMSIGQMERQLRLQAKEAQEALRRSAERSTVQCSFRVVRGTVPSELLAAALEADLLALGRAGQPFSRRSHLGSTAKMAIEQGERTILLMRPDMVLKHPITVIYDGSEGAIQALAVAAQIARQKGTLQVLIWAENDEPAKDFMMRVEQQLQGADFTVEYRRLTVPESKNLPGFLHTAGIGLLVLSDIDSKLGPETIHILLEELDYPILLVRKPNK